MLPAPVATAKVPSKAVSTPLTTTTSPATNPWLTAVCRVTVVPSATLLVTVAPKPGPLKLPPKRKPPLASRATVVTPPLGPVPIRSLKAVSKVPLLVRRARRLTGRTAKPARPVGLTAALATSATVLL